MLLNILLNQETWSHLLLILRCWKESPFYIKFKLTFPLHYHSYSLQYLWITQLWVNFLTWSNWCSPTSSGSDKQEGLGICGPGRENRTAPYSSGGLPSECFYETAPPLCFICQSGKVTIICLLYVRAKLHNPTYITHSTGVLMIRN